MTLHVCDAGECGDLFVSPTDNGLRVLVDDAQGGIRYWPGIINPETASRWFEVLRRDVAWESLQRPMYDRIVDIPRLLATFQVAQLLPSTPLHALPLHDLLRLVQGVAPAPYTSIGLNLYRDGRDSVAMHGDKLHMLAEGHPITLVSLGAPRRMLIRAKHGKRETIAIDLAAGSVLRMSHAAQSSHEHGIPKTRRDIGARMSVVFRARPAGS